MLLAVVVVLAILQESHGLWGFWTASASADVPAPAPAPYLPGGGAAFRLQLDERLQQYRDKGRGKYLDLQNKGIGAAPCWRDAFAALDTNCRDLGHQEKQRLAMSLASCHLLEAGKPSGVCRGDQNVHECLAAIPNDLSFSIYTDYLLHVEGICFFLQSDAWQAQTEGLVNELGVAAASAWEQAERSRMASEETLKEQQRATEAGKDLLATLHDSTTELAGIRQAVGSNAAAAEAAAAAVTAVVAALDRGSAAAELRAEALLGQLEGGRSELAEYLRSAEEAHEKSLRQHQDLALAVGFVHGIVADAAGAFERFRSAWWFVGSLNVAWVLTSAAPMASARAAVFAVVLTEFAAEYLVNTGPAGNFFLTGETLSSAAAAGGSDLPPTSSVAFGPWEWERRRVRRALRYAGAYASLFLLALAVVNYLAPGLLRAVFSPGRRRAAAAAPEQYYDERAHQHGNQGSVVAAAAAANGRANRVAAPVESIVAASAANMDFRSLSRKEVQQLVKQHGCGPANAATQDMVARLEEHFAGQ